MRASARPTQPNRRPLRLPIEPFVSCPRVGPVPVERCFGCELLQGTMAGDHPTILCAYPATEPALRRAVAMGPGRIRRVATRRERGASDLIFDSDWPDE